MVRNLQLAANGVLTSVADIPLNLTAQGNATIASGGVVTVDGLGYGRGAGPGAGTNNGGYSAGGGHGGTGSNGNGCAGGAAYDDVIAPTDFGSGGGSGNSGGAGGGTVALTVAGTLQLDGRSPPTGAASATIPAVVAGGSCWLTLYACRRRDHHRQWRQRRCRWRRRRGSRWAHRHRRGRQFLCRHAGSAGGEWGRPATAAPGPCIRW